MRKGSLILLWSALAGLGLWTGSDLWHTRPLNRAVRVEMQPAGRVNPNTADWPSLARLPGLGPAKAQAIVAYRLLQEQLTGRVVFRKPGDLAVVKGIGPATVEQIGPFLEFSAEDSAGTEDKALN